MTRLNDERIAEIEALWSNDRQTVMDHIPDLLAEVKALRVEKDNALAQNAVTMLDSVSTIINGIVNGVAGEDGQKHLSLGIKCPYCGSHFDNVEEAKEHDGVCESHPAVIRAKKAEAERDVLARVHAGCGVCPLCGKLTVEQYDPNTDLWLGVSCTSCSWSIKYARPLTTSMYYAQQQAEKEGE